MTKFKVTLNFTFDTHDGEDSYGSELQVNKRIEAFERTEKYYSEHNLIDYIKTFSAMDLMEYVMSYGEVVSAVWDPVEFQIHMVVESDETADDVEEDLMTSSLEDGEYEASGETGWLIFTRGPNGEVFDDPMGSEDYWEYGLLDYRCNPIMVNKIEQEF